MKKKLWQKLLTGISTAVVLFATTGWSSVPAYAEQAAVAAVYSEYHYQLGWSGQAADNRSLTAPAGSYVTALKGTLTGQPADVTGTLAYQVNLSGSGWLDQVENNEETGNTQEARPLEAVRFVLTGQLAEQYDVYYKVYQTGAWTAWSMNGQDAGVSGAGLRIDGIRISIVNKGSGEPAEINGIDPTRPMVALTFDDGPNTPVTARILNSLEAHGGRATFFMVGDRVPSRSAVVARMAAMGCEVGNHTYSHTFLTRMSSAETVNSITATNQNIASACGVTPVLMRPTGGNYNKEALNTLASLGMPAIMWSIDTLDWKTRNSQTTINTVLSQVRDGDIILMHDLYEATGIAAETIIPELVARGYQLVTVSELASFRGGMQPGHTYSQFRP